MNMDTNNNIQNDNISDFLLTRFSENIQTFEKYFPDIAAKFKSYKPTKNISFFYSEAGTPNVSFGDSNKPFYPEDPIEYCKKQIISELEKVNIQSDKYPPQYDPFGQFSFRYLNRLVEIDSQNAFVNEISPLKTGSVASCMIIGVGLGYHLADLFERLEICNTILIEPDQDVFFASLHTFDWANLLEYIFQNDFSFNLILGQTDNLLSQIEEIGIKNGEFLLNSRLMIIHSYNEGSLSILNNLLDYKTILFRSGFFDDTFFGCCHSIKAIQAHRKFVKKHVELGEYKNLPVFIIGSGPSLDNDLAFIRKNQDKAIIIACGTALDTLYHSGIKPDLYACTERTPVIAQALQAIPDKEFLNNLIIISTNVCHPYTFDYFKDSALFVKENEPLIPYIKQNTGELDWLQGCSLSNPFVSNCGVSGAVYLGFNNLYLFGIDCGKVSEQQENHAGNTTLYNEHGVPDKGGAYCINSKARGNFREETLTNMLFYRSGKNIGTLLAQNPSVSCCNCSDGIFIENTKPTHSESLFELFNSLTEIDKVKFHEFIKHEKTAEIDITEEKIQKLISKPRFAEICNDILLMLKKLKYENRKDLVVQLMKISRFIQNKRHSDDLFYACLIEGSLQSFFIMLVHAIYGSEDEKKCLIAVSEMVEVIQGFLVEAQDVFNKFPDYIMGEHRKYYSNNLVGKDMPNCKATAFPPDMNLMARKYDDPLKKFVKKTQ
ncbi:Uncharacterized conserved protein [Succinivibrio dextrinosolvens]|uniref:motility associated factor glycosyltransferase family protein n=1 Tax=Succinivibrio dextrinosolvens TaxID=83771 RepID=UPI0008F26311|nr:6-hydroxymethylpterin diphosphokinase MptE-like protein [Succinivibrio dextrinosolvens]SFS40340.1 Uncharacterized conserved protein [Succinivibrio dextrinosolvens]